MAPTPEQATRGVGPGSRPDGSPRLYPACTSKPKGWAHAPRAGPEDGPNRYGAVGPGGPRDRRGSLAPQLVKKRQRRRAGGDAQVVRVSARGLSTRARPAHQEAREGTAGGGSLASVSPILSCEACLVPSRQEGPGQTPAVSRARGLTLAGAQALLGLGCRASAGAPCWLSGLTDLPKRGGRPVGAPRAMGSKACRRRWRRGQVLFSL